MNKLNIAIFVLIGFGVLSVVWATADLFKSSKVESTKLINNEANYKKFTSDELEDKCKTPPGYTDEKWREHMSHHPNNYKECLSADMIEVKKIESKDLADMLGLKDFTLIDVHIPEQSHIVGTDKFIPYNKISLNKDKLPKDKNAKIVLYCRSGSMSARAAKELISMGYTNVYDLVGGTNAWKKAGYKVEDISLKGE